LFCKEHIKGLGFIKSTKSHSAQYGNFNIVDDINDINVGQKDISFSLRGQPINLVTFFTYV